MRYSAENVLRREKESRGMKMNYIIKMHDENGIRSNTPRMDDIISKRNTSVLITDRIFSK